MNELAIYQYVKTFTDTYRSTDDSYERELRCLAVQFDAMLLLPHEDDLLAGRKQELAVGLLPQTDWGFTFYCDLGALRAILAGDALTDAQKAELQGLADFWETENTRSKVRAAYSEETRKKLTHGVVGIDAGVGFPLYRMGGAQFDVSPLLHLGVDGMIGLIRERYPDSKFYASCIRALELVKTACLHLAGRILAEMDSITHDADRRKTLTRIAETLEFIASNPPETFRQAQQLAFFYYILSGTFNYGRMDDYLTEYFWHDLQAGVLTEEETVQLIMSQWHIIIDRDKKWDSRVILGGKDIAHKPGIALFQQLVMEASRRVRDVTPQLTLRCYEGMDKAVYQKALDTIGEGTTFPMLYNDDVNVPAASKAFGVDKTTAQNYLPFGCGEYVLYNKSFGTPSGAINVLSALNDMVYGDHEILTESATFEDFYQGYLAYLTPFIRLLAHQEKTEYDVAGREAPHLLFSILYEGCLERGRAIFDGGVRWLGGTLETYGNTNTSDSLTAIKKLVFEEKTVTKAELIDALRRDFAGCEALRRKLLSAPKYGNDEDYPDAIARRFHIDLCTIVKGMAKEAGLDSYLAVVINNSLNTTFGEATGASADGRHANTYMANANNPTGGMDKQGITALLNSLVKLPVDIHAGSVQNMRFSKAMFTKLQAKTKMLLKTYFKSGGSQTMITVLNRGDLEDAMVHPEKYSNLIVRVGGFSARFVELPRDIQEELISRTLYD